jgi:dihydropteroate synthase
LHICKFLLLFFAYLQFFLYFCSVKAQIMAIGNVTPDSFYASSRLSDSSQVVSWAHASLSAGADILDIGGCSTRPGSSPVDEEDEWARLEPALASLRAAVPDAQLSLDTFRPEIARRALEQFGALIINDISGGCEAMYEVVRAYHVPYIWTLRGNLSLPAEHPEMQDLDLILDPGFGFIGSTEADYACMRQLDELKAFERPILVGISRKSMAYRPLGLTPETCGTGTQALQLYALEHGATILRTHDVRATRDTIILYELLKNKS